MTSHRVLVAYSSKNGSTAEIAEWIAQDLRDSGVPADALPARGVHNLSAYGAVVLGSAVYEGRWRRGAIRFARSHQDVLAEMPVWLFSSGPLDASAVDGGVEPNRIAVGIGDRLDSSGHITFGGRLAPGARGFMARLIVRQGRGGDFRSRDQVRSWTSQIAQDLAAAWNLTVV